MRSYAEPIIAHPDELTEGAPQAFLWRGRHYAVRSVVATWLDHSPWWRTASPTDTQRRCWRVEATAGMASGIALIDLSCDAEGTWQLVSVHD